MFAALVPKLTGARVILDLHECMPEFFATKFGLPLDHRAVRAVAAGEQASDPIRRLRDHLHRADARRRSSAAARIPDKIGVVHNGGRGGRSSTPSKHPPRARANGRFTLICHGSVEERYGLDTAIKAVASLADEIPELQAADLREGLAAAGAARARQPARRARPGRVQRALGADRRAGRGDRRCRCWSGRDEARRLPRPRPLQQDVRPRRDAATRDHVTYAVGRGLLLGRRASSTSPRTTRTTSRARSGGCTPSRSWGSA